MHCTGCSEHSSLTGHPPLLISHDGSQYASPVGLKTLHRKPLEHLILVQGSTVKNKYSKLMIYTIIVCHLNT